MIKYFPRRKLTLVCILTIVFLVLAFGIGPILKFFEVLAQCLSDFKFGISQDVDEVKIFIWTSRNKVEYKTVQIGNRQSLLDAGFNSSFPVKITIHGFSDKAITSWTDRLRKNYFSVGGYNIFTVDWQSLAESPWYNTAVKNTKTVGNKTAEFLKWLVA